MSEPTGEVPVTTNTGSSLAANQETLGALVHQLTEQTSALVRSEVKLAQAELTEKGKQAGKGVGMFSAAGLLALYALGALITAVILALSKLFSGWLAALVVGVVLLLFAGIAALLGKKNVTAAGPPKPEQAIEGIKEDIATVKGERS
ncbi:MAG: phage holin family protein [Actinomycetota bacterium]|nr:phage holin family protein [Actinomycetota bacterium]